MSDPTTYGGVSVRGLTLEKLARKTLDRTYHPRNYGARGDGTTIDTAAIQATINAATAQGGMATFIGDLTNFMGATIDLGGCEYLIDDTLTVPTGANLQFRDGSLIADETWSGTTTDPMIEAVSSSGLEHEFLTFDHLHLDCGHQCSGLRLNGSLRILVHDCYIVHFYSFGVKIETSPTLSHEILISSCYLGEYIYGETGWNDNAITTGTAIDINSPDCIVCDTIIFYSERGILVNDSNTLIFNVHIYTARGLPGRDAMLITSLSPYCTIHGCYFDNSPVYIQNPWHTRISGCLFYAATGSYMPFITLQPQAANVYVRGLIITGNNFTNTGSAILDSVIVDTSSGSISAGNVTDCHIKDNSFRNVNESTTQPRARLYKTSSTQWVFDFDSVLPFGVIQWANYSIYPDSVATHIQHKIRKLTGTMVRIESDTQMNATVYCNVDVNVPLSVPEGPTTTDKVQLGDSATATIV